jgi:hypothetical protein
VEIASRQIDSFQGLAVRPHYDLKRFEFVPGRLEVDGPFR